MKEGHRFNYQNKVHIVFLAMIITMSIPFLGNDFSMNPCRVPLLQNPQSDHLITMCHLIEGGFLPYLSIQVPSRFRGWVSWRATSYIIIKTMSKKLDHYRKLT